jgi:hypothetical protein
VTEEQLQAIKARRDAATPGEWEAIRTIGDKPQWRIWGYEGTKSALVAGVYRADSTFAAAQNENANAQFIAAAPADIDALLAEVQQLQGSEAAAWREVDRCKDALQRGHAEIDRLVKERAA